MLAPRVAVAVLYFESAHRRGVGNALSIELALVPRHDREPDAFNRHLAWFGFRLNGRGAGASDCGAAGMAPDPCWSATGAWAWAAAR